jgi:ribonuclease PH
MITMTTMGTMMFNSSLPLVGGMAMDFSSLQGSDVNNSSNINMTITRKMTDVTTMDDEGVPSNAQALEVVRCAVQKVIGLRFRLG